MAKAQEVVWKGQTICSWCNTVLKDGDKDVPPSHGICEKCKAEMLASVK